MGNGQKMRNGEGGKGKSLTRDEWHMCATPSLGDLEKGKG